MTPLADFLFVALILTVVAPSTRADYTAAVVEHAVISWLLPTINQDQAKDIINLNLDVFDLYTTDAVSKGADIIVFPEYGITGFVHEERDYIIPFLETVPDPFDVQPKSYVPCHRKQISNITIQYRLSCMALKHNITIVANLMTVYYCDDRTDYNCPQDRRYQHNTDVAFGNSGQLLARYHKENLYTGEKAVFDPGHNQTVVATFSTSFGSFGLFTCFDMLFANPAERLVNQFGVDTMVFPTAWMNELPLLSAVEYQESWSLSYGVNLLAANIHYPFVQMTGSGIYSPELGALAYLYEMDSLLGKMLVGLVKNPASWQRVPGVRADYSLMKNVEFSSVKKELTGSKADPAGISGGTVSSLLPGMPQKLVPESKMNDSTPEAKAVSRLISKGKLVRMNSTKYFSAKLNDDLYNLILLQGIQGHISVSYGNVTCLLDFARNSEQELFALGAFDGLHTMNGNYYVQSCSLVRCASDTDIYRCGGEVSHAKTLFMSFDLSIIGQSKETRLFPEVVTSGIRLPRPRTEWEFSAKVDRIWSHGGALKEPLIAANIFGRLYKKD